MGDRPRSRASLDCSTSIATMVLRNYVLVSHRVHYFFWDDLSRRLLSIRIVNGGFGLGVCPSVPMAGAHSRAVGLLRRHGVAEPPRPDYLSAEFNLGRSNFKS